MNNKTILTIAVVIAIILLIAAVIIFLVIDNHSGQDPDGVSWATRIDQQMTGAELSDDGTVLQDCTVSVKGWRHDENNYLLLDTFQMTTPEKYDLRYKDSLTIEIEGFEDCIEHIWACFPEGSSKYTTACMYMAPDCSWMMIIIYNRHFAISVDGGLSPQEIWNAYLAYFLK